MVNAPGRQELRGRHQHHFEALARSNAEVGIQMAYVLFFLAIGAGSALQSADPGKYPWAPYVAGAITLIAMAGLAASIVYRRSRPDLH